MSEPPQEQPTPRYETNQRAIRFMAGLAVVFAIVSFIMASDSKAAKGFVAAFWAIAPPIWFWYEYTYIANEDLKANKEYRERLKFSQDIAARIWLAIAGIFTANYFDVISSVIK